MFYIIPFNISTMANVGLQLNKWNDVKVRRIHVSNHLSINFAICIFSFPKPYKAKSILLFTPAKYSLKLHLILEQCKQDIMKYCILNNNSMGECQRVLICFFIKQHLDLLSLSLLDMVITNCLHHIATRCKQGHRQTAWLEQ